MLQESGDYWKNGKAGKNTAKKRRWSQVVLTNEVSDQSAP